MLSGKGARVILAVRDERRGQHAAERIAHDFPDALLHVQPVDLANLNSVRHFAEEFEGAHKTLDVLLNNAGVMAIPLRRTVDGFEMHLATNHLGPFALTGLLLPALLAAPAARVVTVSSINHYYGRIAFENLHGERRYNGWLAYGQSKLANLLFAFELQRRFARARTRAISVACHPGFAATNLQFVGPRMRGSRTGEALWRAANVFGQDAASGALPLVYAAVSPDVQGGEYVGPGRMFGLRGHPVIVRSSRRARDEATAERLWKVSEELTGVRYAFPRPAGRAHSAD
jgi:NAD(P)-dependent dehydrogenase (short-subunit alcohol dehydrogenase family)